MGTIFGLALLLAFVLIIIAIIKNDSASIVGGLIVGALALALVIGVFCYSIFSWGYVSFQFYDWFVLKYYPNLPHFTIYQFIGFSFLISTFIRYTGNSDIKDEYKEKKGTRYVIAILNPWLTLLLGYLYLCWFL
jgi:hypothetical protein